MQEAFSKKLIKDLRPLLWIISISGIILAGIALVKDYTGSLPWITTLVGLPWAGWSTVCSFYLNMAKSDHSERGITFESAKTKDFKEDLYP